MKSKWYRSNLAKAVWIGLCHLGVAGMTVLLAWMLCYSAIAEELVNGEEARQYEDSIGFQNEVNSYAMHLLNAIACKPDFETKGVYDPEKIVDIDTYYKETTVTGKNESGLAYRLGDLIAWEQELQEEDIEEYVDEVSDGSENNDRIIVCRRADGTYQYYHYMDFRAQIADGTLKFVIADDESEDGIATKDILNMLENGEWYQGYVSDNDITFKGIQDAEGKILFLDCWCYDGSQFEERYAPQGKADLLQLANEDERWNGKLQKAFQELYTTIEWLSDEYSTYQSLGEDLEEGTTNFIYLYADPVNKQVLTNRAAFSDYKKREESLAAIKNVGKYMIVYPKQSDLETNINHVDEDVWYREMENKLSDSLKNTEDPNAFVFAAAVDTSYPVEDDFSNEAAYYNTHIQEASEMLSYGIFGAAAFLIGIVWLTFVAGRSSRDDELHLAAFDKLKTEIAFVLTAGGWAAVFALGAEALWWTMGRKTGTVNAAVYNGLQVDADVIYSSFQGDVKNPSGFMAGAVVLGLFTCMMFLIGYLSLVRRIKAHTLWKNSILRSLCSVSGKLLRIAWRGFKTCLDRFRKFAGDILANINSLWKTCLCYGAFLLVQWIVMMSATGYVSGGMVFLSLLVDGVVLVYLIKQSISMMHLREGIQKISQGDLEFKIDPKGMTPEQRAMAEGINTIGAGLDAAVEESVKSERLKTDLITNVSHDIKTPLTSIINYVDLLKQENFEDPKIRHYIEVLEQKSQRLKVLTEDVVEASKISSGNIHLEYMKLNFFEMIQQTSGEFTEKFEAKGLQEIKKLAVEDVMIRVDGRRTWRILENLYNNVAKYAMPNTRVYTELWVNQDEVCFGMKNISEQPLNISANELTERFIRGDISRSTEGSGLGLSIAQTLTRMQGGRFELYLDGDLFKVTVIFPKAK